MKLIPFKTASIVAAFLVSMSAHGQNPYLIISAMKKEWVPVEKYINHKKAGKYLNIPYITGTINKTPIISTYTGIGSINAGIVTAILINKFHPKGVIFSGVAGGLQKNIKFGDVIISTQIFSVLFGQYSNNGETFDGLPKNPMTLKPAPLYYYPGNYFLNKAKKINKNLPFIVHFGVIASDQHFPFSTHNDRLLEHNKVEAVAMEDIGIAHACWLFKTPFIIIRGISDNILNHTKYTDIHAKVAAKHAASILFLLIKALKN